jgi:hypothetical protein
LGLWLFHEKTNVFQFIYSEYEKTCTPNTDENNNNSDTDLSDNDNEVSFNKTFIQANDVQLNDTEVGNVLTEHKIISQKLDNQISSKRENKNTPNQCLGYMFFHIRYME